MLGEMREGNNKNIIKITPTLHVSIKQHQSASAATAPSVLVHLDVISNGAFLGDQPS